MGLRVVRDSDGEEYSSDDINDGNNSEDERLKILKKL